MATNSNTAAVNQSQSSSFRLKGGLYPLTLLELSHFDSAIFEQDLQDKLAQAPSFFQQSPVLLVLDGLEQSDSADLQHKGVPLAEICQLCRQYGLVPVAVRGGSETLQAQAVAQGLALMPAGRAAKPSTSKHTAIDSDSVVQHQEEPVVSPARSIEQVPQHTQATAEPETYAETGPVAEVSPNGNSLVAPASVDRTTKVITTPVRSGQQVYAAGGDLIILASVSAGAEILADGNIHVYGPLRGRALAGVKGDPSARVFCYSLEAELISIAGIFQLDEDLRSGHWKQPAQISLNNEKISIQSLT